MSPTETTAFIQAVLASKTSTCSPLASAATLSSCNARAEKGVSPIHQHCNGKFTWDALLQDLRPLADNIARFTAHARDISARSI